MHKPETLLIVGAGDRGRTYASYAAKMPEQVKVVGVAEPLEERRRMVADAHGLEAGWQFPGWKEAARRPRFADAVIIATQDALHEAPAVAFARKGYHILLEKPMAPTPRACRRIVAEVEKAGVLFGVCHVLRYTQYTRKLKEVLASGVIGDIVSVQHVEPVGYWHQAHSFVRGNWRNERAATFMLMSKSCHDMDWLRYVIGVPCRRVSSFGSLHHFRAACRPAGAADRCLDCGVEAQCPYSAKRLYFGLLRKGVKGWPLHVVTHELTEEGLARALREGPYGRCVYACDNDVVDHQVVSLEFEGGRSAVFTMTAFTHMGWGRYTRIFGTRGQLDGDSSVITVYDFLKETKTELDTRATDNTILGGHGGGDGGIMWAFVNAVANHDPSQIISGPRETLESHLMVFSAEKARRTGRVVTVPN